MKLFVLTFALLAMAHFCYGEDAWYASVQDAESSAIAMYRTHPVSTLREITDKNPIGHEGLTERYRRGEAPVKEKRTPLTEYAISPHGFPPDAPPTSPLPKLEALPGPEADISTDDNARSRP